jgi:RNA polymerase sigma factor (sigma-70 family)
VAAVPSIGRASRVEGTLAPEADATRALYEQYANQVFRYCLHQLGSREEAEDAVQSTFLNAFRGIKRGVVPELEAAWLFKIAHNVCLSRRRSAWRRGRIESPADFEVIEELAPAPVRRGEELIGLQDVLERLPETQRRAILLREWQGLSYREIAAELELSQAAVETLIFRARRSLASGLEQPPVKKRRLVRALDWSNLLAGLKTVLIGGGAAAKIAATVAVVGATAVIATDPLQHQRHQVANVPKAPATAPTRQIPNSFAVAEQRVFPAGRVAKAPSVASQRAVHPAAKAARRPSSALAAAAAAAAPGQRARASKAQRSPAAAKVSTKQSKHGRSGQHGRRAGTGKPSSTPPVHASQPVPTAGAPGANGHGGQGQGNG